MAKESQPPGGPDPAVLRQRFEVTLREHQAGRLAEAEAGYRQILAIAPGHDESLHLLGVIACQVGQPEPAVGLIERAIALRPGIPVYHFNLGLALRHLDRLDAAVQAFEQAAALQPGHVEALVNLSAVLQRQGRIDAAIARLKEVVALRADHADAQYSLGALLQQQNRPAEAADHFARAVALRPDRPEFRHALGSARHQSGDTAAALAEYDAALALRPDFAEPHGNRALILKDRGDLDGAMAALDQALALKPDQPEVQLNQALIRLSRGEFQEGWRQYEARWGTRQLDPDRRSFAVPLWDGSDGTGRTILIWAEQGLGDTLQFCRYAPLLAGRGWRVVIEAPAPLTRLLGSLAGTIVRPIGGTELPVDCHCPLMSLPRLFETVEATIPSQMPYLAADPAEIEHRRLGADGPKIGLAWSGNPGTLTPAHVLVDTRRSIPLARLAPLLAVPGARFVSLQKDPREDPAAFGLLDPMQSARDFADTAAIVAQLDLVISVDTSVVHLAGAMGKKVWLLNRFDTCWRWLQERDDSPWYPTLRQFRQPVPGDWDSAIAAAALALQKGSFRLSSSISTMSLSVNPLSRSSR